MVTLEKTIKSLRPLLKGNLKWEHIIADSSPQVNKSILSELGEWPLVHFETPPRGIYSAMNAAIKTTPNSLRYFGILRAP